MADTQEQNRNKGRNNRVASQCQVMCVVDRTGGVALGEMETLVCGHSRVGRGGGHLELGWESEGRMVRAASGPQVGDQLEHSELLC